MSRFKNPYDYTKEDFIEISVEDNVNNMDLVDSSGYLSLKDQISIILTQSEFNEEFRRGMIDRFNEDREKIIMELSGFEDDDYVNNQLYKARAGDLIDKESILRDAYNSGYNAGFYPQNRDSDLGDTSTLGAGGEEASSANTDGDVNK